MTAVRQTRAAQWERRREEALARVTARIAEQFPELDQQQVLDAVRGSYTGAHAVTAEPVPPRSPVVRYFRA